MTRDAKAAREIRKGTQDTWSGVYRGRVESVDDPDRLGRVKARIWALHGDDVRTPTSALPWAEVNELGGGGYDYGSFNPPPVGSSIWVAFECANPSFPVVFGTYRGIPERDQDNANLYLTKDNKPDVEKSWSPPNAELETPKDVFDGVFAGDPHPTRRVWHKSYKGHTILIEDGDGKEFLKIIDRSGQIIEMDCPVTKEIGQGNAAQRGTRDAARGDQMSHDAMRDGRALIRIKDLSGQEILFDASDGNERLIIRGRNRMGSTENKITLKSGKGKDAIEIEDNAGNMIRLDPNSTTPITLKDTAGNAIIFDTDAGTIKIRSAKATVEDVPQKQTTVSGKKYSKIGGDEEKDIQGNKKTQVVGDIVTGVMSNQSMSIGGALKAMITNMSPNGSETTPVDITVSNALLANLSVETTGNPPLAPAAQANIKFKTNAAEGNFEVDVAVKGDINETTTLGNVQIGTLVGDATFGTNLGKVTCQTTAGQATFATALGQCNLDGTTCHIGTLAAAIHPLLRGDLAVAAIGTKNTALDALAATISTSIAVLIALTAPMNIPAMPASIGLLVPGTGQALTALLVALAAYFTGRIAADAAEATALTASLSLMRMVD